MFHHTMFTTAKWQLHFNKKLFYKFLNTVVYIGITEEMLEDENDRMISDISSKTRTLKQVGLPICMCVVDTHIISSTVVNTVIYQII